MSIISLSVSSSVRLYRDDVPTVLSATGRIWMDRNLGALRVAQSTTDADSFGALYQWGRLTDGHQLRTSGTTSVLSTTDNPGNNLFITAPSNPFSWRSPEGGGRWSGVDGINNPCPAGFRIPTQGEFQAEVALFPTANSQGAFDSVLKLPTAGWRTEGGGIVNVGSQGPYWTTFYNTQAGYGLVYTIFIEPSGILNFNFKVAAGCCVRCIKN